MWARRFRGFRGFGRVKCFSTLTERSVGVCEFLWRSRFQSLSDTRLRIAVVGNRKYLRDLVESIITSYVEFFDHRPIDFYFLPECHSVTCTPLRKR